ncbi:hypothetical protein ATO7_02715 [Oceanococcus atlanticus]|uniref:diacylglycerol O-acyltransferase n=1 Tax=Oceanococcus atlanticus TaxID=1317117 RepID=A0A1Y1SGG1_9GAMM|nr:wax ester/triacylglycerol synthase family O-acyltransferase [Oceanococcus atlanticus]ORE88752.1 hypothetical protein ATO7_02715 [Oceanococcus atlanticus]RZO84295.1 MAG: wax ester/triacylglycerol synthase family O-acyltransferase [Oceanococcus sp.]
MNLLNPLDASFVRMESKRTPMHVAGLMIFQLPDDAPPDYLSELFAYMRSRPVINPPYNWRLKPGRRARLMPQWEEAREIDIDYHLRHSALPHPGGERELGVLISRLHSIPMDMTKPLWECHLIEGLENRRFAVYQKAHHSAVDGFSAIKMMNNWLSDDPHEATDAGPWSLPQPARKTSVPKNVNANDMVKNALTISGKNLQGSLKLVKKMREMARTADNPHGGLPNLLDIPRTIFNGRITKHRRVATQWIEMERARAISKAAGTTVNDVCLAVLGGALRRYLDEQGALPDKTLYASVPIGLPHLNDKPGNRVVGFVCPMGTHLSNPAERLSYINATTSDTKAKMASLPNEALNQYSVIGIGPMMLGQMTGLSQKLPPMFNVTVSNVIAAKKPLYFRGSQMEAIYPVSLLFDGHTLNVTIVGYADRILFGIVGCRDTIPNLQRIAVYVRDALDDLQSAVEAPKPRRKTASVRKKKTAAKA